MKWINKLSEQELLELHKAVVCKDTKDINGILEVSTGSYLDIDFMENWYYNDGTSEYIPTNYHYYDFGYDNCDISGDPDDGAYCTWLARHFGKEYVNDLLWYKLDMKINIKEL